MSRRKKRGKRKRKLSPEERSYNEAHSLLVTHERSFDGRDSSRTRRKGALG